MVLRGGQSWTLIEGSLNRDRTENHENTKERKEGNKRRNNKNKNGLALLMHIK
jgi:hypothetical protein